MPSHCSSLNLGSKHVTSTQGLKRTQHIAMHAAVQVGAGTQPVTCTRTAKVHHRSANKSSLRYEVPGSGTGMGTGI